MWSWFHNICFAACIHMLLRSLAATLSLLGLCIFVPVSAYPVDWSVKPRIGAMQEYNDNILFNSRYKIDDFITKLIPRIDIKGLTETNSLLVETAVIGEKYIDNSNLDTINTINRLILRHSWNERFFTKVEGRFIKDKTLESELEAAGLRGFRKTRYLYGFDAAGRYSLNERLSMTFGGGPHYSHYPDGPYPDQDTWHIYLDPALALDSRDSIGLLTDFEHADYESSTTVKTLSSSIYYRRRIGETSRFVLGGGYRHTWASYKSIYLGLGIDPESGRYISVPLRKKRSGHEGGFIFNSELNNDWTERFSTRITAGREHYNSVDVRSIDLTYLRSTFQYKWTETISSNLGLSYYNTVEDGPGDRNTDNIKIEPFISWSVTQNLILKFGGAYRYEKEDNRRGHENIDRFKGWIAFSYEYPRFLSNH